MNKHRKTLKEKKLADLRHEYYLPVNYQFVPSITNAPKQTLPIHAHQYLKHDLLRTVFLTVSLVIIQLVMFFMLKNKILKLPMINF